MNNLFGFGSALGDIAKDLNGFVREVVEEFNTLPATQKDNDDNNEDEYELDDDERAIEEELKHQLLQLSDDEESNDGELEERNDITNAESAVSEAPQNDNNNENQDDELQRELQAVDEEENGDDVNEHKQQNESNGSDTAAPSDNASSANPTAPADDADEHKQATTTSISSAQFQQLQQKYLQLKLNYRKSMLLVEKYQIHNKSLKESLNEQLIVNEQQQSQTEQQQLFNNELNRRVIELQSKLQENEMVTQSVSLEPSEQAGDNDDDVDGEPGMGKSDILKLQQTLQKASANMKELKKRYKKVKDDLCQKIEEYDQLKSQYVTQKISASKEIKKLSSKLQALSRQAQQSMKERSGLSKELQLIVNAKFCLTETVCDSSMINPLHLEMIGVVNGCMETVSWLITTSGMDRWGTRRTSRDSAVMNMDNKSDSAVMVHDAHQEQLNESATCTTAAKEPSIEEMEAIKNNVICLRGVICEYIATMQQWLKLLGDAIERKHEMNVSPESNTEEFTNID